MPCSSAMTNLDSKVTCRTPSPPPRHLACCRELHSTHKRPNACAQYTRGCLVGGGDNTTKKTKQGDAVQRTHLQAFAAAQQLGKEFHAARGLLQPTVQPPLGELAGHVEALQQGPSHAGDHQQCCTRHAPHVIVHLCCAK